MSKEVLEREAAVNELVALAARSAELLAERQRIEGRVIELKAQILGNGVAEIQPQEDPLAGTGAVKVNVARALKAWRQREGLTPYMAAKRVLGFGNSKAWKALEAGAKPRGKTLPKLRRAGVL